MAKLKKYKVPVSWVTYGFITIKAGSEEDAFQRAKKKTPGKYLSEFFEIDRDCIEEVK